jgi:bacillithiol system protein YtxJ
MKKIKKIETMEDLENVFNDERALVLKNSSRCPISSGVRMKYEEYASKCDKNINFYIIDVISGRNISEEFSKKTGIKHESPQAIILDKGIPVWNKSHYEINTLSLDEACSKY